MTSTNTRFRIIPAQFDIFAGLDVDKKSMATTFSDHATFFKSLRLPHSARHLLNYVDKHFAGKRIAFVYEAGPTGFGLHDELVARNHTCLVVAPSMVPTAPGKRVKTNRLDSRNLSLRLRGGELNGIHVPGRCYRELRHLVQLRDTQIRQLTATKCRIKALLLYEGIEFPDPSGRWNGRAIDALYRLSCSSEVRFKLDHLIGTLYFHFNSAATVQKRIRQFCKNDPELHQSISLLTTLPGVGWITAAHAVARRTGMAVGQAVRTIEIELRPMLGRVAVAPAGQEAFGGLWPGNFGGNLDAQEVREGTTVMLPIFHEGAYFYFGDGHALQGDGEFCGSGLETTMAVTLQFELIKGKKIAWPRIENETHIMVVGSVRPLGDALRIAGVEMVEWVAAEYGLEKWDAYQVVSQLAEIRVANMVDPNHTVVVKMPKRYLPK